MRRRLPHTLDVAIVLVAASIPPLYALILFGGATAGLGAAEHVALVGAAALAAGVAAGLLGVTAERQGDARSAAIGGAFAVLSALLLVHGAGTPGFIVADGQAGPSLAGALTLPAGGLLLVLASHPALRGPRHVGMVIVATIGALALIAALLVRNLGEPGAMPAPDPLGPVGITSLAVGLACFALLATRASSTYLMTRRRRDLSVAVGLVWLGAAQVAMGRYESQQLGFWVVDVAILAGIALVGVPVALDLSSATPSRPLGGDLRAAELVHEQESYLGAQVRSLMARLVEKDLSTEEHTRRVAVLAVLVGERLGLGAGDLRTLATAGLLHDIGKLRVPDRILKKPDRLTDEEYELIRRHPVWGDELLGELDGFSPALRQAVRQHHERLDGTGYPDAVDGDEISFFSRIVAVADVFDALTSPRVYRDAWPPERALAEIHRCVGTEYDAEAFAALERVVQDGVVPTAAIVVPEKGARMDELPGHVLPATAPLAATEDPGGA